MQGWKMREWKMESADHHTGVENAGLENAGSKLQYLATPLVFNSPGGGVSLGRSP